MLMRQYVCDVYVITDNSVFNGAKNYSKQFIFYILFPSSKVNKIKVQNLLIMLVIDSL